MKAEIEILVKINKELRSSRFTEGVAAGYGDVLSTIASLQQEQGDLEEEITRFFSQNPIPYEHIFGWPILKNTAIHFAEWGATHINTRKEE